MGEGMIVRRGGGTSLNYKVVDGTSQPVSPKENTIWVNTSTAIASHVFSAIQPTNPVEGTVWFKTGNQSAVLFNALKKNGIILHPLSAKQYISGTWITKTAKSYQDGDWLEWIADTYLYNAGDACEDITGGWQGRAWRENSGDQSGEPTITFGTDSMVAVTSGGNYARGAVEIVKDFDLTDFKTITAKYNLAGSIYSGGPSCRLMAINRNSTYWGASYAEANAALSKGTDLTATVDISAVNGAYDIAFGLRCAGGAVTLTVKSVLCEMGD